MKAQTVSSLKRHGVIDQQGSGLPSGKIRILYDYLAARKGETVSNNELYQTLTISRTNLGMFCERLNDFWGMDIRSVPDCHHKCLVGEWRGNKYVDYVAEKLKD